MRICHAGIRFYFVQVLRRKWPLFDLLRGGRESRLPTVLTREEVRALLDAVSTIHKRAFLATVYACGLRLQEPLHLEVSDIDAARMMLHVHRGNGAKDRFVPLPSATLFSATQPLALAPPPAARLPGARSGRSVGSKCSEPDGQEQRAGARRAAKLKAGITKRGVSVHTLRHAYATHLLEAGVNLRVIQQYMGHSSPRVDDGLPAPHAQGPGGRLHPHQLGDARPVRWHCSRKSSAVTGRPISSASARRCPPRTARCSPH